MTTPAFLALIPRPVRIAALVVFLCAVVGAAVAGYSFAVETGPWWVVFGYTLAAMAGGLFVSSWILGLGYIYADARRRAMRPVLWVIVAIVCPHLLGFLLYFVLREPIAARCFFCGNAGPAQQRFCSWCGQPQTPGSALPLSSTAPGSPAVL